MGFSFLSQNLDSYYGRLISSSLKTTLVTDTSMESFSQLAIRHQALDMELKIFLQMLHGCMQMILLIQDWA